MADDYKYGMNEMMRKGGRGAQTGLMPAEATGSKDFTVQPPDTHSPTDQFIYEPLGSTQGAWAVYPPGVPCDPGSYRISRATPADAGDFAAMQSALDDAGGGESVDALATSDNMKDMLKWDTGDEGTGGSGE